MPIKGAVLLFGKNREPYFSDAWATATDPGSRTSNRTSNALDRMLKTGPLGVREAMNAVRLKPRATFLSNYLQPALKTGLIQMTQPDSPKSPTQKCRIVKTA